MDEIPLEPFTWWLVLGFAYSVAVGQVLVSLVIEAGHRVAYTRTRRRRTSPQQQSAAAVGYFERALYTALWLTPHPELILGWLALKAAGVLRQSRDDQLVYNTFLLGTGLSLAFGVAGGMIVELLEDGDWERAIAVAVGPVALSLWLAVYTLRDGRA